MLAKALFFSLIRKRHIRVALGQILLKLIVAPEICLCLLLVADSRKIFIPQLSEHYEIYVVFGQLRKPEEQRFVDILQCRTLVQKSLHPENGEHYAHAVAERNQLTKNIFSQGVFEDDVTGADMRPFVLEGGSIDTDGHGTLLTTTECLTSVNRNEYMTRDEIESELKQYFGLDRVLWLDHGGIIGDDTDGHVDTLARFCSPDTIAYVQCTDPDDPHYDDLAEMEYQLRSFRTKDGKRYRLVPLPLPDALYLDDYRLPASYANFLIVNGGVLVPGSGSEKDEVARRLLQEVFPDREVVVIDCRALLSGHGSLHCVTMQFPEGWLRTE